MNMDLFEAQSPPSPITVKDLSGKINSVLEARIGRVDVVGQVNKPSFKHHWYFSLTDGEASLDCAMWASKVSGVQPQGWKPKQGDQVIIRGTVGHFAKYGKTQIYVEKMKPAAEEKGELQIKYEALLQELRGAGWFDASNKKPLPAYPRRIAVITSATSAAVRDVIETARQRWPAIPLLIVNVPVQGVAAASAITNAIQRVDLAAEEMHIDAIIVTRGGGSFEELWSFNERSVAEATFHAKTPIVAAIGHESDTSIIELVADHRAPTPTQAAMVLVPDAGELMQMVDHFASRLHSTARRVVELDGAGLSQIISKLNASATNGLHHRMREVSALNEALHAKRPHAVLRKRQERAVKLDATLEATLMRSLLSRRSQIDTLSGRLDAIGPRAVFKRGFSLTQSADGTVLRSSKDVKDGQELTTVLAHGTIKSRVECTS